MSLINPDRSGIVDGTTADASDVLNPLNTIIDEFNGRIDSDNLADSAVTTAKIADANISYAKMLAFDKASVTRTSTQLIGNSTATPCSFTSAEFQRVAGDMWVVGDPTKIIIQTTGKYIVTGNVSFATNSTGIRSAALLLNAASLNPLVETEVSAAITSTTNLCISSIVSLNAGDYLVLSVYQTSGGNLNVNNSRLSVSLLP